jgi:hypothetical protein
VNLPIRVRIAEPGEKVAVDRGINLRTVQIREVELVDSHDTVIANLATGPNLHRSTSHYPEEVERAKQIAHAVNCHAELVAVLFEALEQTGCDGDLCAYRWHEKARAILAKAKGGQL